MWTPDLKTHRESQKIRAEMIPYAARGGFDLGCGTRKVFGHFVGVDSGKDRDLFAMNVAPDIVSDCAALPMFADESTHCVFSSHLLEHIADYRSALREWWRLVKEGGYLCLYLPHRDLYPNIGVKGASPDHVHDFHPDDIIAAMREIAGNADILQNQVRDGHEEYSFFQVYEKLAEGSGWRESWSDPKPEKTVGIVRPGAFGDAIWSSAITAEFKRQGYHVTVYTGLQGGEVLAADPNIDRLIAMYPHALESDEDWVLYYLHESRKFTRWVNLIGTVEVSLLPHPQDPAYLWSDKVRHARCNKNYMESMFEVAELPTEASAMVQRYYPNEVESQWATEQRAKLFPGPLVVIAPTGSGPTKTWPHVQRFMDLMAARGVYTLVLGDVRQELRAPKDFGCVLGRDLSIRLALALALTADAVVGTETAITNAVANEPMPKVLLLSHSSPENLTKHWTNTMAVEPAGIGCYPCHRLHRDFTFCQKDAVTGFAACQAAVSAEVVADALAPLLDRLQAERKAA